MLTPIFDDIDISLFESLSEEEALSYLESKYGKEWKEINEVLQMTEYKFNNLFK